MHDTSIFHSNKGFTLVEVIIALAVLVIGVLGVFSMQLMTIKGNANAISLSRSVQETSSALDRVESLSYDDAKLDSGTNFDVNNDLFGSNQNFSGTLIYNVNDLNGNDITTQFGLVDHAPSGARHANTFSGSQGKVIQVNSTQRTSGDEKTLTLQYIKVNY